MSKRCCKKSGSAEGSRSIIRAVIWALVSDTICECCQQQMWNLLQGEEGWGRREFKPGLLWIDFITFPSQATQNHVHAAGTKRPPSERKPLAFQRNCILEKNQDWPLKRLGVIRGWERVTTHRGGRFGGIYSCFFSQPPLLALLRFTSWRGNLSASPSAKPSGCDRAGGVKFTGWLVADEQRSSRLELLLTQWVPAYRLDQGFWPAAGASACLLVPWHEPRAGARGSRAPEEHQSYFSGVWWYFSLVQDEVAWWSMVHLGAGAGVPHQ